MNMNLTMAMEGFYSLKVHGGRRGEVDFGTHQNLILDAGINNMLNGKDPLRYVHVGSGSSRPSIGQSQLDAKFAYTNRNRKIQHGYVSADDSESGKAYGYSRLEVEFDQGAAKGNISEIGVGNNTAGNLLWSRTLILDKNGEPTTITVLDDEYLTVTYELRRYEAIKPSVTTIKYDDDGVSKVVECQVIPSSNKDVYGWGSAGVSESNNLEYQYLTGPNSQVGTLSVSNSTAALNFTYGVTQGNDVDISRVHTARSGGFRITPIPVYTALQFNPPLRKTKEFELTIGITVTIERA